ncbi:MAG: class I SAM-dependent methyltransferase [bacterium]|nr:class I SAM-dependent methyltransferase [bacterium]
MRTYLRMIRQYTSSGRLLDIGCSYGLFVQEAIAFFECTGMDINPEIIALAADKTPMATFMVGALPIIPCHNLDVITALDVLEHVSDPSSALAAMRTALRPGGIALIVVPVYDGPLGWLANFLDHDPTHLHKKSRSYWLETANRYFEVIEWKGFMRKLLFGRWYLHLPMARFRALAPAIAIILKRQ